MHCSEADMERLRTILALAARLSEAENPMVSTAADEIMALAVDVLTFFDPEHFAEYEQTLGY